MYLQVSDGGDHGNTLHHPVVAAARASLHLHAGRPQHEVGVLPIHHRPLHLHHLRPNFTDGLLGLLCLHWWAEETMEERKKKKPFLAGMAQNVSKDERTEKKPTETSSISAVGVV